MKDECGFPGCERDVKCVGLCNSHYAQHLRGKRLTPLKVYVTQPECPPGYRYCTNCQAFKVLDDFYPKKGSRRNICKTCTSEYSKAKRKREAA